MDLNDLDSAINLDHSVDQNLPKEDLESNPTEANRTEVYLVDFELRTPFKIEQPVTELGRGISSSMFCWS